MPFRLQVNDMNEKMSFKIQNGCQIAVPPYMGRNLQIYCKKFEAKVQRLNYKILIDQIDVNNR